MRPTHELPGDVRHARLSDQDDVMSDPDPTAGWQAVQCESLRLTRVHGVPLASEAAGVGDWDPRGFAAAMHF